MYILSHTHIIIHEHLTDRIHFPYFLSPLTLLSFSTSISPFPVLLFLSITSFSYPFRFPPFSFLPFPLLLFSFFSISTSFPFLLFSPYFSLLSPPCPFFPFLHLFPFPIFSLSPLSYLPLFPFSFLPFTPSFPFLPPFPVI